MDSLYFTQRLLKLRYDGSLTREDRTGVLHVDTKGKVVTQSIDVRIEFLAIVDNHSRFTFTRPLRSKAGVSDALLQYVLFFERQTGKPAPTVHSEHNDGATHFLHAMDIFHKKRCAYHTNSIAHCGF